jgi:hypothetical protein
MDAWRYFHAPAPARFYLVLSCPKLLPCPWPLVLTSKSNCLFSRQLQRRLLQSAWIARTIPRNTWQIRQSPTVASKSDVFQRLIGLETEYALLVPPSSRSDSGRCADGRGANGREADGRGERPGRYGLYRDIVAALRGKLPTVPARHMKEGVFHAAGGAVWFETERPAAGGGLIEGATPECRSPRQLVAWQRAQDELLAESVSEASRGRYALIKNDRDALGNVYGAQESYEATFARGWRLDLWRTALVLLLPLVLLTWLVLWIMDRLVIAYALLATLVYLAAERIVPRPQGLSRLLFGCDIKDLESDLPTGPVWLESFLSVISRIVTAPLALLMMLALWLTAFAQVRRQMLPFFVSRAVISGAGSVDDNGRYLLADKALAVNCVLGLGGFWHDRPMVTCGHFFKVVNADAGLFWGEYCRLFRGQQRLQVALGDSNMSELAEYLRVGTTLLVLDCIEAGELPAIPRIARPIRALHTVCSDPSLKALVRLGRGRQATALEIQRFYLEACRRFVERRPDAPLEAHDVLHRWEAVLDSLVEDPQSLVGSLDWVTKHFVLEKAGRQASWQARKKIDLRYHELSPQGYFQRLRTTGIVHHLLERSEIDHARRNPPAGTPAMVRGRYIREFSGDDIEVAANWQAVFLRHPDGGRRVIRLDGALQPAGKSTESTRRKPRKSGS